MIGRLKCWAGLHAWSESFKWRDHDVHLCTRCGRQEFQP